MALVTRIFIYNPELSPELWTYMFIHSFVHLFVHLFIHSLAQQIGHLPCHHVPRTVLRNKADQASVLAGLYNVVETNTVEENKIIPCRKSANTVTGRCD